MPAPYPQRPATALRSLEAPRGRLLPYTSTKAQISIGLSLWLDEISGSRQSRLNQVMESIDFVALNFRQKQPSPDAILYKMIQLQRALLHFEAQKLDKMLAMFPTFQRLDI
jgi:hypothetical protein